MSNKALNWAFAQKIKSGPKFVLVAIADRLLHRGSCELTIREIQSLTGISSNRTVVDHIFYLEERGLIERKIHGISESESGGGRGKTCFIIPAFQDSQSAESTLSPNEVKVQFLQGQSADFSSQSAKSTHQLPIPNKPNKRKRPVFNFSSEDMRFAEWMRDLISDVPGKRQSPDLSAWANTIRLMRERDDHTHREIAIVFKWANSNSFWKTNILSADKLREKFGTLSTQMESGNETSKRNNRKNTTEQAHDNLKQLYTEVTGQDCAGVQEIQPNVRPGMGFSYDELGECEIDVGRMDRSVIGFH